MKFSNQMWGLTAFLGLSLLSSSDSSSELSDSSLSDISYVCMGDNGFSSTFVAGILFPGSVTCFSPLFFSGDWWGLEGDVFFTWDEADLNEDTDAVETWEVADLKDDTEAVEIVLLVKAGLGLKVWLDVTDDAVPAFSAATFSRILAIIDGLVLLSVRVEGLMADFAVLFDV